MNTSIKNVKSGLLRRVALLLLVVNSYTYAQITATNVCPATTVDLMARVTGMPPAGMIVTWHTSTPATAANRVAIPTGVGAGTYYAAYYDAASMCYGNTTGSLTVTITTCGSISNTCPATTVDLTARVTGTPPAGTAVTWHTGTPATAANQVATPSSVGTGTYYAAYYDVVSMCYGNTTSPLTVSIIPCSAALQAKVYLQGALFGVLLPDTLMRDNLRTKGLIPTTSPYPGMGLPGLTNANVSSLAVIGASSTSGQNAIVDWVFVELRSPTSSTTVVDSRSALVQRDGDIVDVDGVSPLKFDVVVPGSFYVAVRHRNHLGVMTASPVTLSTGTKVVDFRKVVTPTFNQDSLSPMNIPQVAVEQGVAMWAGNALFTNTVDSKTEVIFQGTDNDVNVIYQQVLNSPTNTFGSPSFKLKGYYISDINLDGESIFQGTGNDAEYIYQNVLKNHTGNTFILPSFKIREQLP